MYSLHVAIAYYIVNLVFNGTHFFIPFKAKYAWYWKLFYINNLHHYSELFRNTVCLFFEKCFLLLLRHFKLKKTPFLFCSWLFCGTFLFVSTELGLLICDFFSPDKLVSVGLDQYIRSGGDPNEYPISELYRYVYNCGEPNEFISAELERYILNGGDPFKFPEWLLDRYELDGGYLGDVQKISQGQPGVQTEKTPELNDSNSFTPKFVFSVIFIGAIFIVGCSVN
uniref:Uncharacterized protein n=1 Tax=Pylaiella littoralis TaxID=2885 RepID=Q94YY7_PYLLI|nr:hypothetical protein PylioMp60 [Pylaiella littoralis]CAC50869.1 hypothetical protein [Pylaiella littoralis]